MRRIGCFYRRDGVGFCVFRLPNLCCIRQPETQRMARLRLADRVVTERGLFNPLLGNEPSPLHWVAALQTFQAAYV